MEIKLFKRTFLAAEFPKGSKDRENLNCHTLTSEYSPSKKYAVIRIYDETERRLAHTQTELFDTKQLAEEAVTMWKNHNKVVQQCQSK